MRSKKFLIIISAVFFLFVGFTVKADTLGEKRSFYVDSSFDLYKRSKLTAVLIKITPKLYFYADEKWWDFADQDKVYKDVSNLGNEFQKNIYPKITSVFGHEWRPGIDGDPHIFVLFQPMKKSGGGYFNSGDEYSKLQNPRSNEHEMVYLNSKYVDSYLEKSFLAHEFTHLITFNQKENTYGVTEDTWLNEARAEYAPTLAGYDDNYKGSNLERRVELFTKYPSDSLLEWNNEEKDYGSVNLFIHYIADQYGVKILADSLHSPKVGIESINYALKKNGFKENFSQVFLDWTIAVYINDCNYGNRYCYLNKNLRNFRIFPQINFLPLNGKSALTFADITKNWTGNWYKVVGGRGDVRLTFNGKQNNFNVPYIIRKRNGGYVVKFLKLDKDKKGTVVINNFGKDNIALVIIPSIEDTSSPNNKYYSFSWTVAIEKNRSEAELTKELLKEIDRLRNQIALVQAKIEKIMFAQKNCDIRDNLYYGLRNNKEVSCLQLFLAQQGSGIYPEKLITGNFLNLTKSAVIRFQEKFAKDILYPLNLKKGTGFVGKETIKKIRELIKSEK